MEEPGGLQSMGLLRVRHDWVTSLSLFTFLCIEEGNGNPLQCSCLENPRDGGAWWAAIYGVAQSQTRLKRLSSSVATVPLCFHHRGWWGLACSLWVYYLVAPIPALYEIMAILPSTRKSLLRGASLVVQWLRLCASPAGDAVSTPGQGPKIPHAEQCGQKKESLLRDTYWRIYRWDILQRAMNSMLTDLVFILKAKGLYWKKSSRGSYKIRFVILEDHCDLSQLRQILVLYESQIAFCCHISLATLNLKCFLSAFIVSHELNFFEGSVTVPGCLRSWVCEYHNDIHIMHLDRNTPEGMLCPS